METTKTFLDSHPEAVSAVISELGGTPIFYAVLYRRVKIVELLLQLTPMNALEICDVDGLTPLHAAVLNGSAEIAKLIVERYSMLLLIPTKSDQIPLLMATNYSFKAVVQCLYPMTPIGQLEQKHHAAILNALIYDGNYGKVE